jgi:hypothetical protein
MTIEVFEGGVTIVGLGKALECLCMTPSTFTTQLDVFCPLHGVRRVRYRYTSEYFA